MKTFTLTIELDGAAFDGDVSPEVTRILRAAAESVAIRGAYLARVILDANGNACGAYRIQNDPVARVIARAAELLAERPARHSVDCAAQGWCSCELAR